MNEVIARLRDKLGFAKLVGEAPAFIQAIAPLPAVAQSEAPVLIQGETGTGKELVARAIHYLSRRAAFPFVALNCGSLPETLLEDEFFGHEAGAFTDARLRRPGLMAQAEKGTLFLDEVDSLPPKAQVALLRVLQDRHYRALGACSEQLADVRVVAASNVPLEQLVQARTFRADLYYRLCIFSVELPPLRQRKEDILVLAQHFLKMHAPAARPALLLGPAACAALLAHDWPGNVRELENTILRASHLSEADTIAVEDLGLRPSRRQVPAGVTRDGEPPFKIMKQRLIADFERDYLAHLLVAHQGNVSQAARAAGKERRYLGKLLKKYHLDPESFRICSSCGSA